MGDATEFWRCAARSNALSAVAAWLLLAGLALVRVMSGFGWLRLLALVLVVANLVVSFRQWRLAGEPL